MMIISRWVLAVAIAMAHVTTTTKADPLSVFTLLGTELPSDLPSDSPSDLPSDIPSEFPSDMPSDEPSLVPSDMPSDEPSSIITGRMEEQPLPGVAVILEPTTAPIMTTAAPTTLSPTMPIPTTAAPSITPTTMKPTQVPTTSSPTPVPTTQSPTELPTTLEPTLPLSSPDCIFSSPPIDVIGNGRLLIQQGYDLTAQTISVRIESSLGGYIAFGYTTGPAMMSFTDIPNVVVVGQLDTSGSSNSVQKYTLGGYSPSLVTPVDSSTLQKASMTETDEGTTVLEFTKPLVEAGETPVSTTTSTRFIYAYSTSPTLRYHSFNRGSAAVTISECLARRFLRTEAGH